jgi:hypothetical protein
LEPEKESASPSRTSLWPLALLGTLLFALFSSKRNQPSESVHPQDTPDCKSQSAAANSIVNANVPPTEHYHCTTNGGKNGTPRWEKVSAIAQAGAVLVGLGLLIVNVCLMRSTDKAANAAQTSAQIAQAANQPALALNDNILMVDPKPMFTTPDMARINLKYSVKNFGTAIAYGESDYAVAVPSQTTNFVNMQKEFVKSCWTDPAHREYMPSPNEWTIFNEQIILPGMAISGRQTDAKIGSFPKETPQRLGKSLDIPETTLAGSVYHLSR